MALGVTIAAALARSNPALKYGEGASLFWSAPYLRRIECFHSLRVNARDRPKADPS